MLNPRSSSLLPILAVVLVGAAAATPALAEAAKTASKKLPAVEEVVVVSEVDLTPVTLASKLISADAFMKGGKKFGKVSDVVLDGDNRATALIVGVGGFLGFDETYVAVPMSKVTIERDGPAVKVVASITEAELKKAEHSS